MGETKSVTFKASEKEFEMMHEMKDYLEKNYGGTVSKAEAWIGLLHFGYSWMNTAKAEAAASVESPEVTPEPKIVEPEKPVYQRRRPFDLDYYKDMANK